jgi:hypothetical protein
MRLFKKTIDYDRFLRDGLAAIFGNVPLGFEITKLRIQLDPEYDYSSIEYNLEKIEAE